MKNLLVKYKKDCGRMGFVDGLFVCTEEELKSLYGQDLYFGEILGKHSEVEFSLTENELQVLTEDQEFISELVKLVGKNTIAGRNPLNYFSQEDEE